MSDWRPIETAPKDGAMFLASDGLRFMVINEPPGHSIGYWTKHRGGWAGAATFQADRMTHWMPLPEPPA